MCAFAGKSDGKSQFKKTEAVSGCDAPQFLCSLPIERRLRINEDTQQAWLIPFIERVQNQLHAISQKLLKLRVDRIINPSQTADGLAFAGLCQRQTRGTGAAHNGFI